MTERPVRTEMPNSIELSVVNKFRREIWTKYLKGIKEYELIQSGKRRAAYSESFRQRHQGRGDAQAAE